MSDNKIKLGSKLEKNEYIITMKNIFKCFFLIRS